MKNKFSGQINKNKLHKKPIEIKELLADHGYAEMISRAKNDGRYLSLSASNFVPDPKQPRKKFEQTGIDSLRLSIEKNGQLQPILVGDPLADGKYPIIAGERRWRAINESTILNEVQAVVRRGFLDEFHLLLMQIDENNQREQISSIENAMSMKRIVELCKAEGNDQAYAATLLNMSPGHLSKCLALLDAPKIVTDLSLNGETQDVEVLYNLTKANEGKPEAVVDLINKWRSGTLDKNFRKASKELINKANEEKKLNKRKIKKDGEINKKTKKSYNQNNIIPEIKKVSTIYLNKKNDNFILTINFENEKLSFVIEENVFLSLKNDILKNTE